jgi:NAD(P)-dependent dehydrogenase (short-subunit alcohol dehydrogenase family)
MTADAARLRDRIILITGATDDIGYAAALACARHGATVVAIDQHRRALEKLHDEIVALGAPQPAMLPLDLAALTPELAAEAAAAIDQECGRLDGLLHAAQELGALAPLELYDPPTWARVLHVNLTARWLLTRACLPLLKKSSDASIVFSTSDVARAARAYWGAFAAAGFGTEALVQMLAQELEANTAIRVNSIDPGPVRSFLRQRAYPGEDPRTLPAPAEVMDAYLHLLGPESRGTTGQALRAQGAHLDSNL